MNWMLSEDEKCVGYQFSTMHVETFRLKTACGEAPHSSSTNRKQEKRLLSSEIETWGVVWAPVSYFYAFLTCRIEKSTM